MFIKPAHVFFMYFFVASLILAADLREKRILFIDVDGVLNNANSRIDESFVVEDDCLVNLKKIFDQTNTEGVLSSGWRTNQEGKKFLKKKFKEKKIPLWVGETPVDITNKRANEIFSYLTDRFTNNEKYKFAIIDDLELIHFGDNTDFMNGHFVFIDKKVGLTEKDVQDVINILTK